MTIRGKDYLTNLKDSNKKKSNKKATEKETSLFLVKGKKNNIKQLSFYLLLLRLALPFKNIDYPCIICIMSKTAYMELMQHKVNSIENNSPMSPLAKQFFKNRVDQTEI